MFGATLHVAPGRSEWRGHQLLQRAGMVRQVAQGIFSYLPLGWRTVRKIQDVLRAEMTAVGGQEVSLPVVNPADLWQRSGRYFGIGPELARFADRRGRDLVLAMTHEEIVTDLARTEIASYRDLPRLVYQIQTKFRDDARPRAGLIRVREFLMKDAYSFDVDDAGLAARYDAMYRAYQRIFARCGVPVTAVASDVGMMGGHLAHEFMYLTPIGEDTLLLCDACGYAANREAAAFRKPAAPAGTSGGPVEVATPDATTIEALTAALGIPAERTAKALFVAVDRERPDGTVHAEYVVAVVRGDMELNEVKLANLVHAGEVRPMTPDEIARIGAVAGYGSPVGVAGATVVVDDLVATAPGLVAGANRAGYHLLDVVAGRDYTADHVGDIVAARAGDPCVRCGEPLRTTRGVEAGQIFKLGTRYADALGAGYLDVDGRRKPLVMGCYGIGVGRLLGCAAEEHHDGDGLRLPITIAPYQVHLCPVDASAADLADSLYRTLTDAGVEVLYDDRDERAGVKFADADVIGLPLRLTIGRRSLARGGVELRERAGGDAELVPTGDVPRAVRERIAALHRRIADRLPA
ncbi:proline--tRNA ligase [Actinocatenispora rupis]|uniref:Proline--tRNA ligase n=2 Tax=Actinocatenispora rupis TaxID=519421 RepID=A0A8J3J9C3_9ACTN|nr:proline--tRNA ligase [Actinocatenispora rupis]